MSVIHTSSLIQRHKLHVSTAVLNVLQVKPDDKIEFVLDGGRVYLRKRARRRSRSLYIDGKPE